MTGGTLFSARSVDDILDGDAGADAGLSRCGMAGIAGAEAGSGPQVLGIDACHVGQRTVAGVAEASDRDIGMVGGKDMAHRMALDAGVGIAVANGCGDRRPGAGVTGFAGRAVDQMHAFDVGPGSKRSMACVATSIGRDVMGRAMG